MEKACVFNLVICLNLYETISCFIIIRGLNSNFYENFICSIQKMRPLISPPKKAFENKSAFTYLHVFTLLEILIQSQSVFFNKYVVLNCTVSLDLMMISSRSKERQLLTDAFLKIYRTFSKTSTTVSNFYQVACSKPGVLLNSYFS